MPPGERRWLLGHSCCRARHPPPRNPRQPALQGSHAEPGCIPRTSPGVHQKRPHGRRVGLRYSRCVSRAARSRPRRAAGDQLIPPPALSPPSQAVPPEPDRLAVWSRRAAGPGESRGVGGPEGRANRAGLRAIRMEEPVEPVPFTAARGTPGARGPLLHSFTNPLPMWPAPAVRIVLSLWHRPERSPSRPRSS